MSNFIESKEFIGHLDSWLFKSNVKDSGWIYNNRNKIPSHFKVNNNFLYKGVFGIPELFDFRSGFVSLHGTISFSEDEDVARKFISDDAFKFRNSDGLRIIIKKKFTSIVFDVYKYYLFYGEKKLLEMGFDEMNIDSMQKEKEVLVHNVKIYSKDFKIIR